MFAKVSRFECGAMIHNLGEVKNTKGIIGLMFKLSPPKIPYFIPLPTHDKDIQTWFMFFPIDILYVNGCGRVVDKKSNLYPWKLHMPLKLLDSWDHIVAAIEAPAESFNKIDVGDIVEYKLIQ
jgi:uncharacterized membrane protein (UPF0127 family)